MAVELQGVINELLEGSIKTIGKKPVINELNVAENGIYTPPSGVDGFAPVKVNISKPTYTTEPLSVTENGTYAPPSGVDGFAPVNVNISIPTYTTEPLRVTENGTYTPPSGVDGFAPVNVNVPEPIYDWITKDTIILNKGQSNGRVNFNSNITKGWYSIAFYNNTNQNLFDNHVVYFNGENVDYYSGDPNTLYFYIYLSSNYIAISMSAGYPVEMKCKICKINQPFFY